MLFGEEVTVSKLSEKVNDLLVSYEELKAENERLRQEVVTLKAQNEVKDTQIQKLEQEVSTKDIEADDILGKIEEVLKR